MRYTADSCPRSSSGEVGCSVANRDGPHRREWHVDYLSGIAAATLSEEPGLVASHAGICAAAVG